MPELHEALAGLAALLVSAAFVEIRSVIRRRVDRAELEELLLAASEAVEDAVLAVSGTLLAGKSRPLSGAVAADAHARAMEGALEILGPERAARLERLLKGKLAGVLSQKIEAALARRKEGGAVFARLKGAQ
jgi:hypothetical protein